MQNNTIEPLPANTAHAVSITERLTFAEAARAIEAGMHPFNCVASARDGYVRVWNCYCGSIMLAYNRRLDEVCAGLGMKWGRKRTFGNGMINAADWEDQARFVEGGKAI